MTTQDHVPAELRRQAALARERITEHVARAGLNRSLAREAVIDTFLDTSGHVSAEELTALVKERAPGVGQTTVYRALKLLVDCGVAAAREFGEAQTRYERVLEGEHHDHLVCAGCGAIAEFEDAEIEALQEAVARQHGFEVTHHRMELYGRCRACTAAGARRS